MSKTTKLVTVEELKSVALPTATDTYTVISHGFIIDEVKRELHLSGFEVVSEEYRANNNLEVARGSYIIKRSEDPNFMMSFSWTNSYDKSTKFQCAIGGYVLENNSFVIDKEENTFIRKHTGTADVLVKETIAEKIGCAEMHYLKVLSAKRMMESITVNRQEVAKILGDLYFSYDIISIEQLSGIKKEYNKPSYVYSTNADSLWTVYCHILTVIKSSHPKMWLQQQGFIHNYIKMNFFKPVSPVSSPILETLLDTSVLPEALIPEQLDLLDAIAEAEAETEVVFHPEGDAPFTEEVVKYVDLAGNTFEVPVVDSGFKIEDDFTTEEIEEVKEMREMLSPKKTEGLIKNRKILSVLKKQVDNVLGYKVEIEVCQNGDNYDILTSDNQEITVPISYVQKFI
jgi:hypothetical protein